MRERGRRERRVPDAHSGPSVRLRFHHQCGDESHPLLSRDALSHPLDSARSQASRTRSAARARCAPTARHPKNDVSHTDLVSSQLGSNCPTAPTARQEERREVDRAARRRERSLGGSAVRRAARRTVRVSSFRGRGFGVLVGHGGRAPPEDSIVRRRKRPRPFEVFRWPRSLVRR